VSFNLAIAVKRDPSETSEVGHGTRSSKTLVFDASGTFSHEGAAALAQRIDGAISPEFTGYVVRFHIINDVDNEALLMFAQWVRGRREEGLDRPTTHLDAWLICVETWSFVTPVQKTKCNSTARTM
jgi:hypothetical protein